MNKRKILFILPTLSAGGTENYVLRFIKHYLNDFEFHVLSVDPSKGDLHDEFEDLSVTIFYQSIGYFEWRKARIFYKILNENNYSTVVSFTGNFSGWPLTIAKYAGVKNRIGFHRRSTNAFGRNPIKLLYNKIVNQLLRKNATKILSNSEAAFKYFYKNVYKNNPKYEVIPNGVDVDEFDNSTSKKEARQALGLPEDAYIIGHVGRYNTAKNHETIFKVINSLESSCENFKFVFCGRGTDSEAFQSKAKKHQVENRIITLGMRRDLPIVYKAFDMFYFPSITEGQPNALIEAMLSDLPIITSNIPSIKECLPPNAKVCMVNPQDVVKVVDTIHELIKRPEKFNFRNFARKNFNSSTQFELLKKKLIND